MRHIHGVERDELILRILRRIDNDTQIIGAPERTAAWENGWREALERFRKDPCEESLIPAFVRDTPVRISREFYDAPRAERDHIRVMQTRIGTLLQDCPNIAEFGSGTGLNLVALAKRFPHKNMHAYDFAPAAVELADLIREKMNLNIYGHLFDMKKPEANIQGGYGVFTFGAIEQLAGDFMPFMEFLVEQKPRMVVHIEPTVELYDPENLVDSLAIRFHQKRGYTNGLLPWLEKNVNLIQAERTFFGSMMHEGYTMMAWKCE